MAGGKFLAFTSMTLVAVPLGTAVAFTPLLQRQLCFATQLNPSIPPMLLGMAWGHIGVVARVRDPLGPALTVGAALASQVQIRDGKGQTGERSRRSRLRSCHYCLLSGPARLVIHNSFSFMASLLNLDLAQCFSAGKIRQSYGERLWG